MYGHCVSGGGAVKRKIVIPSSHAGLGTSFLCWKYWLSFVGLCCAARGLHIFQDSATAQGSTPVAWPFRSFFFLHSLESANQFQILGWPTRTSDFQRRKLIQLKASPGTRKTLPSFPGEARRFPTIQRRFAAAALRVSWQGPDHERQAEPISDTTRMIYAPRLASGLCSASGYLFSRSCVRFQRLANLALDLRGSLRRSWPVRQNTDADRPGATQLFFLVWQFE